MTGEQAEGWEDVYKKHGVDTDFDLKQAAQKAVRYSIPIEEFDISPKDRARRLSIYQRLFLRNPSGKS